MAALWLMAGLGLAAAGKPSCKSYCTDVHPTPLGSRRSEPFSSLGSSAKCCTGCTTDGCHSCGTAPKIFHCPDYCTCTKTDPPTPPPAPTPVYPAEFCPKIHFHGKNFVHDPSAPFYVEDTKTWHVLPDVAGGQGHSWSTDLVHWKSDPDYQSNTMCCVPETGSITKTSTGLYFIYAGYARKGYIESGAYRAVSTDPVGLSGWITGPNSMNGSVAAAASSPGEWNERCLSYPCAWNVIPHPKDNPHDFRDPSEAFLHSDGHWYMVMGSTSTPGGPNTANPKMSATAAARVFRAKTPTLERFEEVGYAVETNISLGQPSQTTGAWSDKPAWMWVMECPSFFQLETKGTKKRKTVLYASMLGTPFQQYHQESWVGDFDDSSGALKNISHHTVLDYGLWYAAKGHVPSDDPSTHIAFGWMHCLSVDECNNMSKVCGNQYTIPRLITLSDDARRLQLKPLPNLVHLHYPNTSAKTTAETAAQAMAEMKPAQPVVHHAKTVIPWSSNGRRDSANKQQQQQQKMQMQMQMQMQQLQRQGHTISELRGSVLHLQALLPCSLRRNSSYFGVHVLSNSDLSETTTIGWDVALGKLSVRRNKSGEGHTSTDPQTAPVACPAGEVLNLTVVVDGGMVESYVNDVFAVTSVIWTTDPTPPQDRLCGLVMENLTTSATTTTSGQVEIEEADQRENVVFEVWHLQTDGVLIPPNPYG